MSRIDTTVLNSGTGDAGALAECAPSAAYPRDNENRTCRGAGRARDYALIRVDLHAAARAERAVGAAAVPSIRIPLASISPYRCPNDAA